MVEYANLVPERLRQGQNQAPSLRCCFMRKGNRMIFQEGVFLLEYPSRKQPRLTQYNYRSNGAYFVTICAHQRKSIFSRINPVNQQGMFCYQLTPFGEIAAANLLKLEQRFPDAKIEKYTIMPNHIHAIISLDRSTPTGASLSDIICAYKSLTTRECKRLSQIEKVFQNSFHDHVIRSQKDYEMIWQYIDSNPRRWREDCFYEESQNIEDYP